MRRDLLNDSKDDLLKLDRDMYKFDFQRIIEGKTNKGTYQPLTRKTTLPDFCVRP